MSFTNEASRQLSVLISPTDSFRFNIKNVETDKFHNLHDNIQYALG